MIKFERTTWKVCILGSQGWGIGQNDTGSFKKSSHRLTDTLSAVAIPFLFRDIYTRDHSTPPSSSGIFSSMIAWAFIAATRKVGRLYAFGVALNADA
jgi:hypothetical protein